MQRLRLRDVGDGGEVGVDGGDGLAVERALLVRAVIKADHRNVDVRAVENPIAVALGEEDVAAFLDALEDFAVRAAANGLRGQQTDALDFAGDDMLPGFLEPIATEVGFRGHGGLLTRKSTSGQSVKRASARRKFLSRRIRIGSAGKP